MTVRVPCNKCDRQGTRYDLVLFFAASEWSSWRGILLALSGAEGPAGFRPRYPSGAGDNAMKGS